MFPEPPVIEAGGDPDNTPEFITVYLRRALETPEIDAVIAEARAHFRAGESLFRQRDLDEARGRFDAAIDTLLNAPADALDRHRVIAECDALAEAIHGYDVDGLSASAKRAGFELSPLEDILDVTFPVDPNVELNVREELKLPVSELPLEVNGEVMRYISYFSSSRGRPTLVRGLQRAGRYRTMIQRILDEEGVPQELIYLAQAESAFGARAISRKRATGMWQFMSYSAKAYGLHSGRLYDDRLDPEKATRAAARHLRDLYEELGDWYLAMAAYNCGQGRVDRGVRRTGYADFWELSRRKVLPRQTRNYVPLILAIVIMSKNPGEYGLEEIVPDPPLEYNTIEVRVDTHLGLIADVLGRPLSQMNDLNPAILKNVAPAGYTIRVPKGTGNFVLAALETVPASRRASWRVHRVGYGETLNEIAYLYKTTADRIAVANGGTDETPETGDLLVIPVSYSAKKQVRRTGTGI